MLAAREGVDPVTDRRPRLAVLAYGGADGGGHQGWRTGGDDSVEAMLAAFDAYAEQLSPALFDRWT